MSPARARSRTAQYRDEGTNHEATAPPTNLKLKLTWAVRAIPLSLPGIDLGNKVEHNQFFYSIAFMLLQLFLFPFVFQGITLTQ